MANSGRFATTSARPPILKHPQAGNRRLRFLIGILLACGIALPVTRLTLLHRPAPLSPAADVNAQRQYWRDRIKQNVADVEAYVRLGVLEEKAGFYTSAVKYLRAARVLGAPDSAISGPLGRALTRLARDDEALPELEKAAKLAPDSVDAVANLAGLYVTQNAPGTAAAILKRFTDAHPSIASSPDAGRLSLCLLECGDSAAARNLAERAVAVDAGNMVARSVAARTALDQKDFGAARRHLETLLKQAPDDGATR